MLAYDCTQRPGDPPITAVLLHPHPDMGGDRHHPIMEVLYQGLAVTTLRFDFTSSLLASAQAEVAQAIDLAPDDGVVLVGYSFGADVALTVDDARVLGWYLIAPPLQVVAPPEMVVAYDQRPKRLVVPQHDQFSSPERAQALTSAWIASSVVTLPGSDHFLNGMGPAVLHGVQDWLPSLADR